VVIFKAGQLMLREKKDAGKTTCGGLQLSVALTMKFVDCEDVEVPEISPVELRFKPVGKEPVPIAKLTGAIPPEVCNWYEYGWLTVPLVKISGDVKLKPGHETLILKLLSKFCIGEQLSFALMVKG
jgi:hypothetical protein